MSTDQERQADENRRMEAIDAKRQQAEKDRIERQERENPAWVSMDYMEYRAYLAQHTNHYI
ncbi:MAG: hypothetical protein WCD38_11800 [Candidatus Tumulicola sp.]